MFIVQRQGGNHSHIVIVGVVGANNHVEAPQHPVLATGVVVKSAFSVVHAFNRTLTFLSVASLVIF
jgi:hypothetical protein